MLRLQFNITSGRISVTSGTGFYTINATSGKGACMNNPSCIDQKNQGPIPVGRYTIDRHRFTDLPFYKTLYHLLPLFKKGADWGDWYVPLVSRNDTKTFGRRGFYLHGGVFPGSAGCIDIGGGMLGNSATKRLMNDIVEENIPITLEVGK